MGFVEDADTIRAKAHLGDIPRPALAGIALGAILVVALVIGSVVSALGALEGADFSVAKDAEGAVEHQADDTGAKEGEDASVATAESSVVIVHVTGAVAAPGVYGLADGDRVQAAIDAAGGFAEGADTAAVNCARVAQDGEQINVPSLEEASNAAGGESAAGDAGAVSAAADGAGSKVNINRADAAELDTLPGVGPSTAEKIIADREANGPFASVEDLKRVSGIGDKKYEQLAGLICV